MPILNSGTQATPDQVREQRDRILACSLFARSLRQRDFLTYIVDATLDGRGSKLKESALGVEVFGKDDSFDPAVDSIVRVEASRLRGKLLEYYGEYGQSDPVRIDIPKGHYVPVFSLTSGPTPESRKTKVPYLLAGIATLILLVSTIYFANRNPMPADTTPVASRQPTPSNSIAVLPLRDRSDSPEEHFSEAMTDALIMSLGGMKSLQVTSFTSVLPYRDSDAAVPEIGRTLNVAYLVEGSVVHNDSGVRIAAQLIDADTDTHLWANSFDRPSNDLLAVQSEIAAEIATQISGELVSPPQTIQTNVNPAAYEAYMKGRYFYNQFTADGYARGMQFFQEAIDIEPGYAEAYAGLASCHCLLAGHGLEMVSPVISIPQAHAHATKALELNNALAEPFAFLGIIEFKYGWDAKSAETQLARAITMNPNLYQAHVWHSQILEALGRHQEAVNRAQHAKQLNPLSLAASLNLGWQMFQAGQFIEATSEIDKLIEFNPQFWGGHWVRGHIYNRHGLHDRAIDEFEKAVELEGGHTLPIAALGYSLAIAGRKDRARQIIGQLDELAKDAYVSPFHVATVYAGLNEPELMFEQLEKAYQVRARSLAWLQVTSELMPFRDDARFQNMLDRIGIFSGIRPVEPLETDI